jgi:hypothetical protein
MINAINKDVTSAKLSLHFVKDAQGENKMAAIGCSSAVACCMNHDGIQFVSSGFLRY